MSTTQEVEMSCYTAAAIIRADIARFCNEPQDPELVAEAEKVATAHYHGFGNCGECRAEGARTTVTTEPGATSRQKAYVRKLLAERAGDPTAEKIRQLLNEANDQRKLTVGVVSTAIDGLLQLAPTITRDITPAPADVPNGRYALPADDGHYVFYKVNTPTEGRWAGYTFTVQLIGSVGDWTEQRLPKQVATNVLGRIAADVEEAARMFGIKAKACGYCCSPLSNIQSRAAGYGETCAAKNGHYYPTADEAADILAERGES